MKRMNWESAGAALLLLAGSVVPAAAAVLRTHTRSVMANTARHTPPTRHYHVRATGNPYVRTYQPNDTVIYGTPYGYQVYQNPYYYPNGLPYYGPWSGWNVPATPQDVTPVPLKNQSPLGPIPTQSPLGKPPTQSILKPMR